MLNWAKKRIREAANHIATPFVVISAIAIAALTIYILYFHTADSANTVVVNRFSVFGSGASIIGIEIALFQIFQTKRLVRAAKDASEQTARELKIDQYRHSLETARHLLREVRSWIGSRQWHLAAIRTGDFADHASSMAYGQSQPDEQWSEAVSIFMQWSAIFRNGKISRELEYDVTSWSDTYAFYQDKINREYEQVSQLQEDV